MEEKVMYNPKRLTLLNIEIIGGIFLHIQFVQHNQDLIRVPK